MLLLKVLCMCGLCGMMYSSMHNPYHLVTDVTKVSVQFQMDVEQVNLSNKWFSKLEYKMYNNLNKNCLKQRQDTYIWHYDYVLRKL